MSWEPVVFAPEDPDGPCPSCGGDYADCPCIGPMEEDVEYRVTGDVLEGRRVDGEQG